MENENSKENLINIINDYSNENAEQRDDKESSEKFIKNLVNQGKLRIEYFDIFYSKEIQPSIFKILERNIQYINELIDCEPNKGIHGIQNYEDRFGFIFNMFYCIDTGEIEKIEKELNRGGKEYYKDYINSFNIPVDLISFGSKALHTEEQKNSRSDSMSNESKSFKFINEDNQEINLDYKETKKNIETYQDGKKFELISLERFHYSSNLKKNFTYLENLPNIIFYLMPLKYTYKLKNYFDNNQNLGKSNFNNLKEYLNYRSTFHGYYEIDAILKNETKLKKEIEIFEHFKIKKKIIVNNNDILESEIKDDYIIPYSINFIEIKKSLSFLKSKNQLYSFLKKCKIFKEIFEIKKISKLERPSIFDINGDESQFPLKLDYDYFFIINNNEKDFEKNKEEIYNQIKRFTQENDNSKFTLHLYFSKGSFDSDEIKFINSSKIINEISRSYILRESISSMQKNFERKLEEKFNEKLNEKLNEKFRKMIITICIAGFLISIGMNYLNSLYNKINLLKNNKK